MNSLLVGLLLLCGMAIGCFLMLMVSVAVASDSDDTKALTITHPDFTMSVLDLQAIDDISLRQEHAEIVISVNARLNAYFSNEGRDENSALTDRDVRERAAAMVMIIDHLSMHLNNSVYLYEGVLGTDYSSSDN